MRVSRTSRDSASLHWSAGSSCRHQSIAAQRCKPPGCRRWASAMSNIDGVADRLADSPLLRRPFAPGAELGLFWRQIGGMPLSFGVASAPDTHTCEGPRADRSLSFPPDNGSRLRSFGPIREGRDELPTLTRAASLACPVGNKAMVSVAAQNLRLTHIRKWQLSRSVRQRRIVRLRPNSGRSRWCYRR